MQVFHGQEQEQEQEQDGRQGLSVVNQAAPFRTKGAPASEPVGKMPGRMRMRWFDMCMPCRHERDHYLVVLTVEVNNYELRAISRVPFDTTRSIWTFVTNQRRILDDNAPENSRFEAQLLVVKIPGGGRRTCRKGTPPSKKHCEFF